MRRHDYTKEARWKALDLIREGITSAAELSSAVDHSARTVQRWFHRPEFIAALEEARPVCPHCHGTGKLSPQVYYARLPNENIKIGMSQDPIRRVEALGAVLLAVEPGGYPREAQRHREFAALRLDGEEFEPGPALLDHIAQFPLDRAAWLM